MQDLDKKSYQEFIDFAESKELAQAALNSSAANQGKILNQSLKEKLAHKGKCTKCNKEISLYKKYSSGKLNRKAFKMCAHCHKENS